MKFREQHQEGVSIDLTPFIDVVFMLLLFFVVSTALFKNATQLGVQLPKANTHALGKESAIEIGVDKSGYYFLNGVALKSNAPQKLKAALAIKVQGNSSQPLILVGDKEAPHQAIVSALEVAQQLGLHQVNIVAERSA